jgi:hypothetical protein
MLKVETVFSAADFDGAQASVPGRLAAKQREGCRGGQDNRRQPADIDIIRIGVAAKSMTENIEAIAKRRDARHRIYVHQGKLRLRWRNYGGGHPSASSLNRGKNHPRIEGRDQQSTPGLVRHKPVSIGEGHGNAGSQPPVHIQHR